MANKIKSDPMVAVDIRIRRLPKSIATFIQNALDKDERKPAAQVVYMLKEGQKKGLWAGREPQ